MTVAALRAALAQNNPNPFNPKTTIEYTLAQRSAVVVAIYDAAGRQVRRLDQGRQVPGTYSVAWDGRDDAQRALASGTYFYRLEGVTGVPTRKMLLIK